MSDKSFKLALYIFVTLLVIFFFLMLYFDLRDLIFEDIRLPSHHATAAARTFLFWS